MKILLLILCITCCSLSLSAQKIHFTDTSNVWKELGLEYNDFLPPILSYTTYSFVSDSSIDSVKYGNFSFGSIREDTILNKVFIRDYVGDSDILLMDYNLNVGDTFIGPYHKFAVLGMDSTLINSAWHKVWYFPEYTDGFYIYNDTIFVIEGVGCLNHPTYMVTDFRGCVECEQPYMYCFSNNGITPPVSSKVGWLDNTTSCATFPHLSVSSMQLIHDNLELFPNPVYNEFSISSSQNITNTTITNFIGQTRIHP